MTFLHVICSWSKLSISRQHFVCDLEQSVCHNLHVFAVFNGINNSRTSCTMCILWVIVTKLPNNNSVFMLILQMEQTIRLFACLVVRTTDLFVDCLTCFFFFVNLLNFHFYFGVCVVHLFGWAWSRALSSISRYWKKSADFRAHCFPNTIEISLHFFPILQANQFSHFSKGHCHVFHSLFDKFKSILFFEKEISQNGINFDFNWIIFHKYWVTD